MLQNIWCLLLFRFTADLRKLFPPFGDHGNMTPNSHLINSWKVFLLSYGDQSRYSTWFLSESFMPDAKDDWLVKGDLLHQQKITTLVPSQKCRFQLNPPRMRIATERHHHALWTYLSSIAVEAFPPSFVLSSCLKSIRNPSCRLIEHAWHLLDNVECHLLVLHISHHNCLGNEKMK